jgi:NAD(P)-dependent dehydrogenase (short-subunit alcohol dehydrogenase family)
MAPIYAASKAGVLQYMRSIASQLHANHGIRVCSVCPGGVRTSIMADEAWDTFDPSHLTPVSMIVAAVDMLVAGGLMRDSKGKETAPGKDWGLAVEVNRDKFYFRDQVDYGDGALAAMMDAQPSVETANQRM